MVVTFALTSGESLVWMHTAGMRLLNNTQRRGSTVETTTSTATTQQPLTHSLTHSRTHSLFPSPIQQLPPHSHALTHSLTLSPYIHTDIHTHHRKSPPTHKAQCRDNALRRALRQRRQSRRRRTRYAAALAGGDHEGCAGGGKCDVANV